MIVAYQCAECKGTNIQLIGWINPNTMEAVELTGDTDGDTGETWCEDCDAHMPLERV